MYECHSPGCIVTEETMSEIVKHKKDEHGEDYRARGKAIPFITEEWST